MMAASNERLGLLISERRSHRPSGVNGKVSALSTGKCVIWSRIQKNLMKYRVGGHSNNGATIEINTNPGTRERLSAHQKRVYSFLKVRQAGESPQDHKGHKDHTEA